MLKVFLSVLVVLLCEQSIAQEPKEIPKSDPSKQNEAPIPKEIPKSDPKEEIPPPRVVGPAPVPPKEIPKIVDNGPQPPKMAEAPAQPPMSTPQEVAPPPRLVDPEARPAPPVAVVPKPRLEITAKQLPVTPMMNTGHKFVTEVPSYKGRKYPVKELKVEPLVFALKKENAQLIQVAVGVQQVTYQDPPENYNGRLFRGKIRIEKPFPKAQDETFQKIRLEVRNVIDGTVSENIGKFTVDDYGLTYYDDQEFALAFYPPDQKDIEPEKRLVLDKATVADLRYQFLTQLATMVLKPAYLDITKQGQKKLFFGVTVYDDDAVREFTEDGEKEFGQKVHDFLEGTKVMDFRTDKTGTGNLHHTVDQKKFSPIEFTYYVEDNGVAIPLSVSLNRQMDAGRRRLTIQIANSEKERKAAVLSAVAAVDNAKRLFALETAILAGEQNTDQKKEDRKTAVINALAQLEAAKLQLANYGGEDPIAKEQLALIPTLKKTGSDLQDRLTYPIIATLPDTCKDNFLVQQEARDRSALYFKKDNEYVRITYTGTLQDKSFVCQDTLAMAVVNPIKDASNVVLQAPSMSLTPNVSDAKVDPIGGPAPLLLGINGGTIVFAKQMTDKVKNVEVGAVSPTANGFRFLNPEKEGIRTEVSADGKVLRNRHISSDTWKTYTLFAVATEEDPDQVQLVQIVDNKEVVLGYISAYDSKRTSYVDGLLTFIATGFLPEKGLKGDGVAALDGAKNKEALYIVRNDSLGVPILADDGQKIGAVTLNPDKNGFVISFRDNTLYQMTADLDGKQVKRNMILTESCRGKKYSVDLKTGKDIGKSEILFADGEKSRVIATANQLKQMECSVNSVSLVTSSIIVANDLKDSRLDASSNLDLKGAEVLGTSDIVTILKDERPVHLHRPLKNVQVSKVQVMAGDAGGFQVLSKVPPLEDFTFDINPDGKIVSPTFLTNNKGVLRLVVGKEPGKTTEKHYVVSKAGEIFAEIKDLRQFHGIDVKNIFLATQVTWMANKVKRNLVKSNLSIDVPEKDNKVESDTPLFIVFDDVTLRSVSLATYSKQKEGFVGFNINNNDATLWSQNNIKYVDVLSLTTYLDSSAAFSTIKAVDRIVLK